VDLRQLTAVHATNVLQLTFLHRFSLADEYVYISIS